MYYEEQGQAEAIFTRLLMAVTCCALSQGSPSNYYILYTTVPRFGVRIFFFFFVIFFRKI